MGTGHRQRREFASDFGTKGIGSYWSASRTLYTREKNEASCYCGQINSGKRVIVSTIPQLSPSIEYLSKLLLLEFLLTKTLLRES